VDWKQSIEDQATSVAVMASGPSGVPDLKFSHDADRNQPSIHAGRQNALDFSAIET
jgi:hypothetical protein